MTSASGQQSSPTTGGHHKASKGAWISVFLIIFGFIIGTFALPMHSIPLWIVTGALVVLGGITALASRIMEQAY